MLLFKGCKNILSDSYCNDAKHLCVHRAYMKENCPLSCGVCGK